MNLDTKTIYSVWTLGLVSFVFVLTAVIILSMPLPLGSDAYFHMQLSRYLGQGNVTGAIDMMFTINKFPYPVLYHVMIIPISIGPDPYTGLRVLEMIFLPVTFALTCWLAWKASGPKAALITGLVLIGSWSFLDGAIQARPESLDLMFYPLILWAALYGRKKWFSALSIATIYNHGFAALTNIMGIAWKKLRQKEQLVLTDKNENIKLPAKYPWRKTIIISVLIILPVLAISIYYFPGAWSMWSTFKPLENPQEALFWTYPPWIPYYAGITLMGFAFVFRKGKTELESLLKWGLLGNLIMLPFWADRWLQYSSIPLSLLTGMAVSRWHGKKLYITLFVIGIGALIYISSFLLISFFHSWWNPARFVWSGAVE